MKTNLSVLSMLTILSLAVLTGAQPKVMAGYTKKTLTYKTDVAPILNASCIKCHKGAGAPKALDLTTYKSVMKGASGGVKVVIPGKPDKSLIVKVLHGNPFQMPPTGPIAAGKIATITNWIKQGAKEK